MTTIVYRAGILAADSRAYSGDKNPIGEKHKIHRLADGCLIGASSNKVGACEKFRRLVAASGVEGTFEDEVPVQAIVIRPDGSFFYFNNQDSFSGPITAEYMAIGSGEEYAKGALKMGASAVDAVRIAIECDPWTGGKIHTLEL